MFKRKIDLEVVPATDYTDFSERHEQGKPSLLNGALLGVSIAATASVATYAVTRYTNPAIPAAVVNPTSIPPILEPLNTLTQTNLMPVNAMATPDFLPTGYIAEGSMAMLTTVLDPLIQILVAISFPIASVIMVGACFFFMLGKSERAWTTIFNAGLGYVLVQMSPLFLKILQEVGKAV